MNRGNRKSHVFLFYLKLGAGALLILPGTLIYLFFRNYSGDKIPYPTLWYLTGALLLMAGVAWVVYTIRREIRLEQRKASAHHEWMRHTAVPVWVNLAHCEIVTSALPSDETNRDGNDTYSVLKFIYQGKPYYSSNIYKDEDAIRLKIELQKQTTLYINPDGSDYYLDTDFLDE